MKEKGKSKYMNGRKAVIIFLIIIIILGILLRIISLDKDISAEESDFVLAAKSIANYGSLNIYQSEQAPNILALWHPPMYNYALSAIMRFSTSEIAIRTLNVLAILLTSVVIFYFCSRFIEKNGKIIGLVSSALFLINYYVLSSSLLIDIDAFSTLFVFLFIFFTLLAHKNKKMIYYILLSLAFIFSLANRYPIAIIVFLSLFVCFFLKKETREFSYKYLIIGIISGMVFLGLWTFYSSSIEPGTFFSFISHNIDLGASQFRSIELYSASFLLNIAQIIRLFTLPAIILFILAIVHGLRKKDFISRILLFYTLSVLFLFIIVPRPAFGYPRYFFTIAPGFFILISIYLGDLFRKIKITKEHVLFMALVFSASLLMLILLRLQPAIYESSGLIKATNLPDFVFNILCISPLIFIFLFKRNVRRFVIILGVIALFFSYSLYFDVKYVYYNQHAQEAGDYLKEHTDAEDIVICPKAVGYYYKGRFYFNDFYKPQINKLSAQYISEYISESYKNPKMDSEFFWGEDIYEGVYVSSYTQSNKGFYNSKYIVTNYLSSDNVPEKIIGDYYIYKMRE